MCATVRVCVGGGAGRAVSVSLLRLPTGRQQISIAIPHSGLVGCESRSAGAGSAGAAGAAAAGGCSATASAPHLFMAHTSYQLTLVCVYLATFQGKK